MKISDEAVREVANHQRTRRNIAAMHAIGRPRPKYDSNDPELLALQVIIDSTQEV